MLTNTPTMLTSRDRRADARINNININTTTSASYSLPHPLVLGKRVLGTRRLYVARIRGIQPPHAELKTTPTTPTTLVISME